MVLKYSAVCLIKWTLTLFNTVCTAHAVINSFLSLFYIRAMSSGYERYVHVNKIILIIIIFIIINSYW